MATLQFTIDEALNLLRANGLLPGAIRDVRAERDGLRLTIPGGIEIVVRAEPFRSGVLRLVYSSNNWAFRLADKLGKVDGKIDEAIRPHPFLRRDGKCIVVDIDRALRDRVKGMRVRDISLRDGELRLEFQPLPPPRSEL